MFRDLFPLTALSHSAPVLSDATEEGRELKELSDLTEPALEPISDPPGVEGGVTNRNCSELTRDLSYSCK